MRESGDISFMHGLFVGLIIGLVMCLFTTMIVAGKADKHWQQRLINEGHAEYVRNPNSDMPTWTLIEIEAD